MKEVDPFFHDNCDDCGFTFYLKEYLKLHMTKTMEYENSKFRKSFLHINAYQFAIQKQLLLSFTENSVQVTISLAP